jgi:hypothetical protein
MKEFVTHSENITIIAQSQETKELSENHTGLKLESTSATS